MPNEKAAHAESASGDPLRLRRLLSNVFYQDLADAMSAHLRNREPAAFILNRLTPFGNPSQPGQQKAGQRLNSRIARQMPVHLRFQITQVYAAVQHHSTTGGSKRFTGS